MLFDEMFPSEEITDKEIRDYLTSQGFDPMTQPTACAELVSAHWELPIAVAADLVSHLR